MNKKDREFYSRQLIKLGDMMGNGLHHESDGKWISKEYRQISRILYPELYKKKREYKNKLINISVSNYLKKNNCPSCNNKLKQTRSGCKVVKCVVCNNKYKLSNKKS